MWDGFLRSPWSNKPGGPLLGARHMQVITEAVLPEHVNRQKQRTTTGSLGTELWSSVARTGYMICIISQYCNVKMQGPLFKTEQFKMVAAEHQTQGGALLIPASQANAQSAPTRSPSSCLTCCGLL